MHRIAFETLGCRLNQAETAILQSRFVARGYALTDDPLDADVFVLHTCTLTRHAAARCRRRLRHVIKRNPAACIAAIGCHAQTDAAELAAIPGVDYVVGTADKLRLDEIIATPARQARAVVMNGAAPRTPFTVTGAGYDPFHTRANLKIQEGCDFACAFCIIPRSRGRARSREFDDLVREARELAQRGHREVILTGVNIGTYHEGGRTLADVISALEDTDGIERIRISSIEPTTIAAAVLERMAPGGKLCPYLHVPAQSGDDGVLRAMRRHYDAAEYLRFMREAIERVPGIGLGTDVIVGFPGEDEAAFQRSCDVVMSLPFVNVHVFSFSPRPRTSAWAMAGAVAPREIARRSDRLHRIARARQHETYASRAGCELRVLFEQSSGGGVHTGFSDEYIRVETTSPVDLRNRLLRVQTGGVHAEPGSGLLCLRGRVDDTPRGTHSNVHHGEIEIEV
ncbi:MAG TPA: tRNA (N(6)-L-threonylcarbamoyladenosine(37)-C(2))-methylthiotransferase MtaB [Candidatus Krumholzibacteria bacterium]